MATLNREYLTALANPQLAPWEQALVNDGLMKAPDPASIENQKVVANRMLALLDQYGANDLTELPDNVRDQLPNRGVYTSGTPSGFFQQLGEFVTNPGFLMLVGGAAGLGVFGGAGAAAGAGASAGTEAAGIYGAGGEFGGSAGAYGAGAGAGTATLAEQAAGIGSGSAAGTASGTGVGTGTATAGGVATTVGGTAASASALDRILSGNGTASDYASIIGTGFDIYGANKQADASKDLANKLFGMGAPYRDELARISADPQAFYDSPTAQNATESVLRRLSATHGNVAGSPYGQALTIDALYDQYGRERDRLAGFGGLTAYNSAAPGAAGSAVGAEANLYNSIGGGIADITTPRNNRPLTLQDILRGQKV